MEIYWHIFLAFFIPNIVGYGGGPAIIPLIEHEVVYQYQWLSVESFAEVLALGNTLPSPIATKMAGHIGYELAGLPGAAIAVFATVAPSLLLMLGFLGILTRYKDSIKVISMSLFVQPIIAVMMALLTWKFFLTSYTNSGYLHSGFLFIVGYLLLERVKVHPAWVISGSILYGAIFLG